MALLISTSLLSSVTCNETAFLYQQAECCKNSEEHSVSSLDFVPMDQPFENLPGGGTYKIGVRIPPLNKNTFKHVFEMDTDNLPHGVIPGFTKLFMMAEPADTLVPLIATSEPTMHLQTGGSVHYEIDIQSGLKWSDGTSITSDDFAYSFNLFKEASNVGLGPYDSCKCSDPEYPYCYDDGVCYKSATSYDSDSTCSSTNKCGPANEEFSNVGPYATRVASAIQELNVSVVSASKVHIQSSTQLPWMKMRPLLQMPIFPKTYWHPLSHPITGDPTAMTVTGDDAPLAAPFQYSASTASDVIKWTKDVSSTFADAIAYRVCDGGGVTMLDPKSRLSQHDYEGGCPAEGTLETTEIPDPDSCKCSDPEYPFCYDDGGEQAYNGVCYKSASSYDSDSTCSSTNKCGPANQDHSPFFSRILPDKVHFGPHVDSVEFHVFSSRTAMFDALSSTSLHHVIHDGDNWEGIPVQYPFHRAGFKEYRNTWTTQFNMFMDQGKLGDFFPANNKAFRQVMACMTESKEVFDSENYFTAGNRGRYYDDMFSELTSAMGVYDNWKKLGWYDAPTGVFKTCGDAVAYNDENNKVDLDISRSILKAAGWNATDWGGEVDGTTSYPSMYTPIVNLMYEGQEVPTLRLITQTIKPYRTQALLLTQLGMNDLGIDAIVKPEDFFRSYACANVDGTDPVPNNPAGCTAAQQFRLYAGGDKYPFQGDVPSYPASFFSSTGNERFMSHQIYDDLVDAIHSATSLSAVKAATKAFQKHLDEEVPIIPMFKYKHKDVFYRTAIPYTKAHFGGYHTGTTMGGFASVVKII